MKRCNACKDTKPLDAFSFRSIAAGTRQGKCKACQKDYVRGHYLANKDAYTASAKANRKLRHEQHGLSVEEYAYLLGLHDGKCHLCQERDAVTVDHDHSCCPGHTSCGRCVRGILCRGCNTSIAVLGDSLEGVERAVRYLAAVA